MTVGQDCQLKAWNLTKIIEGVDLSEPIHSIALDYVPHAVSHISRSADFVTCGEGVSVWKLHR